MTATPEQRMAALGRVRAALVALGATDEEIDRAVADDVVDLVAVDRLLAPPGRRFTTREVADRSGLPVEVLHRFWRALGLQEPAGDEEVWTDLDVGAVTLFQTMVRLGATDVDAAVHLARVIGSSLARVADAVTVRTAVSLGAGEDSVLAADAFVGGAGELLPAMDRLLAYVWRRHLQAAVRRTMLLRTHGRQWGTRQQLAVGFADMVGFTVLSQRIGEDRLAAVVQRFEEVAYDVVTTAGGRVVKTIGDEAMFVVDDDALAVRIGRALVEAYAADELLGDVRVGLAAGPVLANDGDYFGPTVNLAARIVEVSPPGAVLVPDELHRRLVAAGVDPAAVPYGRCELRGVGPVELWRYGRPGEQLLDRSVLGEPDGGDPRSS